MRNALITAGLVMFVGGCTLMEVGCPCGAGSNDPLSEHDLSYEGDHYVDGACICRCGQDEPRAYPEDRPCSDYETPCEDQDGVTRDRVCY